MDEFDNGLRNIHRHSAIGMRAAPQSPRADIFATPGRGSRCSCPALRTVGSSRCRVHCGDTPEGWPHGRDARCPDRRHRNFPPRDTCHTQHETFRGNRRPPGQPAELTGLPQIRWQCPRSNWRLPQVRPKPRVDECRCGIDRFIWVRRDPRIIGETTNTETAHPVTEKLLCIRLSRRPALRSSSASSSRS